MRRFLLTVLACLGSILSAHAEREVVIVSPHWDGVKYEFGEAFARYYQAKTGEKVQVRWRDLGGTSQIERALDASYKVTPDTCGIDIFFGGGVDPYEHQKANGHLFAYQLPDDLLSRIPKTAAGIPLYDPDYTWYGAALSSFGIVENRVVSHRLNLPEVQTWEDLGKPELFGWVSSADPRKSGSVHMIYEIILQAYGWEKGWQVIYQSSGNIKSFLQQSASPTKEVSSGNAAYAISIDINGMVQQTFLGKESVRFFIPTGVSVMNPDSIAILKGAPNLDVAKAFVDFVLSPDGQKLWMTPVGQPGGPKKFIISRMSVLPELYDTDLSQLLVPVNPFQVETPLAYRNDVGSKRWNTVNEIMGRTIIDLHPQLRDAWEAILKTPEPLRSKLIEEFSTPPITEKQSAEISSLWKKDPAKAEKMALGWMKDALAKYKKLRAEATQGLP